MTLITSSGDVGIQKKLCALLFIDSVGLSLILVIWRQVVCPMSVKYSLNLSAIYLSLA